MDQAIQDWTAEPNGLLPGEDLSHVEQWLYPPLTDIAEDDIIGGLADIGGNEVFDALTNPQEGRKEAQAQPQLSGSTTSSGGDPTSSGGAVCGPSSRGLGGFSRGAAFRSFSTNDLQALQGVDSPLLPLPGASGLSLPIPYGSHMSPLSRVGSKAARPALEPVPEGAPSQGGPLPGSGAHLSVMTAPAEASAAAGLGAAPAPPAQGAVAVGASEPLGHPSASTAAASQFAQPAAGVPASAQFMAAAQPTGLSPFSAAASSGQSAMGAAAGMGMRTVASAGSLSSLMNSTLQIQAKHDHEATDNAHASAAQQPGAPHAGPQQDAVRPASAAPMGADAAAGGYAGTAAAAALAAAAAAAAAVAGMYPPNGMAGASEPSAFAAHAFGAPCSGMYGMGAPVLPPAGAYPMALPPHLHSLAMAAHLSPRSLQQALTAPPVPYMPCMPGPDEAAAAASAQGGLFGQRPAAAPPAGVTGLSNGGECGLADPPGRLRKVQSALELGAWRQLSATDADVAEAADGMGTPGQKLIGRLTREERLQRILRYRQKRQIRNFNREIKYQCRKTLADTRPRVGGRFARNDDPNSVLPHQTKKAQRTKGGPSQAQQQSQPEAVALASAQGHQPSGVCYGMEQGRHIPGLLQQQQQQQQDHSKYSSDGANNSAGVQGALGAGAVVKPSNSSNSSASSEAQSTGASSGVVVATSAGAADAAGGAGNGANLLPHPAAQPPFPPYLAMPCALPGVAPNGGYMFTSSGIPYSYSTQGVAYAATGMVGGPAGMLPPLGAAAPPYGLAYGHAIPMDYANGVAAPPPCVLSAGAAISVAAGGCPSPGQGCQPSPPQTMHHPAPQQGGYDPFAGASASACAATQEAPGRLDSPLIEALLSQMDAEMDAASAAAPVAQPVGGAQGFDASLAAANAEAASYMAMDS